MFDDSQPSKASDRFSYALLSLVGEVVAVHLADGRVIEGIFASKADDEGLRVILLQARLRPSPQNPYVSESAECERVVLLEEFDVVMIDAVGAPLRTAAPARGRVEHSRQFAGEMTRWAEMGDDDGNEMLEEGGHQEGSWDQFATNQQKFGVKTSYSEEQYTTKLDKKKFTQDQQKQAAEIEKGILARGSKGLQHDLERGGGASVDEGTAFSDVQRAPALPVRSTGAYVPPSQRSKQAAGSPTPQAAVPAPAPTPAVQSQAPAQVAAAAPKSNVSSQAATSPAAGGLRAQAAEWRPPSSVAGSVDADYNTEPIVDDNDFMKKVTAKMTALRERIVRTQDVPPLMSREWPGDDFYPEDNNTNMANPNPSQVPYNSYPAVHHQQQHMHGMHNQHHQPQPHHQPQHQHHMQQHNNFNPNYMNAPQQGYQNSHQSFGPNNGGGYNTPHGSYNNPNNYNPSFQRTNRNTSMPMGPNAMGGMGGGNMVNQMGNGPMHDGGYGGRGGGYQDPMSQMGHMSHQNPQMPMHGGHSQHPGMNQGQQYQSQNMGPGPNTMHNAPPPQPMMPKTMGRGGGMSNNTPQPAHSMPQQPQQPQQPQYQQQAPPMQQSTQEPPKRIMSRGRGSGPSIPESAAPAPQPTPQQQAPPPHNPSNPPGASAVTRGRGGKR